MHATHAILVCELLYRPIQPSADVILTGSKRKWFAMFSEPRDLSSVLNLQLVAFYILRRLAADLTRKRVLPFKSDIQFINVTEERRIFCSWQIPLLCH